MLYLLQGKRLACLFIKPVILSVSEESLVISGHSALSQTTNSERCFASLNMTALFECAQRGRRAWHASRTRSPFEKDNGAKMI
jgi:hypothetical protein